MSYASSSAKIRWLLAATCCATAALDGRVSRVALAAENDAVNVAVQSITEPELRGHVSVLADDTLEGREAGSRGGRAAASYLAARLAKCAVKPGGTNGSFFQPFRAGYNNLLGVLEGTDPVLGKQWIIVGAHYDHVGYGNRGNSYGPFGLIHNGADDNASGVAALLEVVDAFGQLGQPTRRSILFALWDGEEKGLVGSKHWIEQPTVPLAQVALVINADMIGRLRNERLEVLGTRTAAGLRRLVSQQNDGGLRLDFTWEIKSDSDHHPFFARQIPVLMLHTGRHNEYHRPSDDADKVNHVGLQQVSQLMFRLALELANEPALPVFRRAASGESPWTRAAVEQPLPALPQRLGIWWDDKAAADGRIVLTKIVSGSPAAKEGLAVRDRIAEFAGREIGTLADFRTAMWAARNPVAVVVERPGQSDPVELSLELAGNPVRLGISSRTDDAEPGCVMLNRVVPGSPADAAGLKLNDRIYQIAGQSFATTEEFGQLANTLAGPLELAVETDGQLHTVVVHLADEAQ